MYITCIYVCKYFDTTYPISIDIKDMFGEMIFCLLLI